MSVEDRKIKALSVGTFFFAGLFLTEGIDLKLQKMGRLFDIVATVSLVPLEVFELAKKVSVVKVVVINQLPNSAKNKLVVLAMAS